MKKKAFIISSINILAITSIVRTIWADFGLEYFLKLGIPAIILVAVNAGVTMALLSKIDK